MKKFMFLAAAAPALALAACGGAETDTATTDDTAMTDDAMATDPMAGDTAMAGEGGVTVTINGVEPGEGQLFVALQNEEGFAGAEGTYTQKVDASGATVTATFEGVAPGQYAAAVIHDQNADGNVELGEAGPTEAWGLSGAAQTGGAPEFGPAAFTVSETGGNATVSLMYPE